MATYAQPWTNNQIRLKWGSGGSEAIVFADPDVAHVSVTARPESRRSKAYTAEAPFPAWLKPTIQVLTDLLQLPQNWDGYGASQVREQIAQQALLMLIEVMENDAPPPSIVPLSDGGVQVEWHRRGKNLEIEFPADEAPSFYYYEDESGVESEGQVSWNYEKIQAYIAALR
ncbi:MAG: hypothetical protein KJZ78_02055 [Bryobacteraceae bacterium]|nr:hypothetical protein [Bryobacteraceae bacterium]